MTRIEKINQYYEKNFEELEKIHAILIEENDKNGVLEKKSASGKNVNADNYKILGWESRQAQYLRFAAFAKFLEKSRSEVDSSGDKSSNRIDDWAGDKNFSILDVGSGLSDLYHFLMIVLNLNIDYVGVDISEKMIETAKNQFKILDKFGALGTAENKSTATLLAGDVFSDDFFIKLKNASCERKNSILQNEVFESKAFDYVYSSGIFNLNLGNNEEFVKRAFLRFVEISKNGFVCSMLNVRSKDKEEPYFYYEPEIVKKWALEAGARDVEIIDDYLENDFTIIAKK